MGKAKPGDNETDSQEPVGRTQGQYFVIISIGNTISIIIYKSCSVQQDKNDEKMIFFILIRAAVRVFNLGWFALMLNIHSSRTVFIMIWRGDDNDYNDVCH